MKGRKQQAVLFEGIGPKRVEVEFTQPGQSSDGGMVLLKVMDEKMGLTRRMAEAIGDQRQAGKIDHAVLEMLRERVYGIACGYPDCNDAQRMSRDPVMKMICGQSPMGEESLASQPTLSRFENAIRRTELLRLGYALTDTVIEQEKKRRRRNPPQRITIDMDPTEDPTYGDQQLTFFNGYYDNWCYLPMVTTIQFDLESDQRLVAPVLRPGNAKGSLGAVSILKRLVKRLRWAFGSVNIHVRLDGAFATPEVFRYLEDEGFSYVVNMAGNSVLQQYAEPMMKEIRRRAKESGRTEKMYGEVMYQAGKWESPRRTIIKAEVVVCEGHDNRDNARFVVSNMRGTPKSVYREYTRRGDAENRIKELKDGLCFDRTSCTRFDANQFRNLLTAAAYILYQELRVHAKGTECADAQVWILRERLIKIGVVIRESVRRILLEGPRWYPWLDIFRRIALRCT